ncbi:uncharacterized protein LOC122082303 [Macadamia integrifolia]|uniref:uncharacterized protein LOC122082303 n=1 Tax=Macadamia integrifolia TaxID=60698 RepID=UPI001C4F3F73|nr:uncharacterized protein LOC122082303 [Macadamia integrifolia]
MKDIKDLSFLVPVHIKSMADLLISKKFDIHSSTRAASNHILELTWEAPLRGVWKLNIDGCSIGNSGSSCTGGILHSATFQMGCYAIYEGIGTNFMAEFAAFFHGIHRASLKEITNLWIECDSQAVVSCIKRQNIPWCFLQIWWYYKGYLDSITWTISHCYQEINTIADKLAKHAAISRTSKIWNASPSFINYELDWDLQHRSRFRFM